MRMSNAHHGRVDEGGRVYMDMSTARARSPIAGQQFRMVFPRVFESGVTTSEYFGTLVDLTLNHYRLTTMLVTNVPHKITLAVLIILEPLIADLAHESLR